MASARYHTKNPSGAGLTAVNLPHVYIHPPCEDPGEPWLCFDANDPMHDPCEELNDGDSTLSIIDDEDTIFDLTACSPVEFPACDSTRALVDTLVSEMEHDHPQDEESTARRSGFVRSREPGNDSDVVEVVKVRRASEASGSASLPPSKRPTPSFFSRAFQSMRNVGKSSKSKTPEVLSDSSSQHSSSSGPQLPRNRKNSRTPSVMARKVSDLTSPSQTSFQSARPASPSLSTYTTRTSKSTFRARRISVMSLQKLFRSSQPSLVQTDDHTDSTASSKSSPSTPVHGTFPSIPPLPSTKPVGFQDPADASLEMHLDSMHFDSLSFDPDDFR